MSPTKTMALSVRPTQRETICRDSRFLKGTRKTYKNKPVGHGFAVLFWFFWGFFFPKSVNNGPVGMQSALCLYSFTYICSQKCALVGFRVRRLPKEGLMRRGLIKSALEKEEQTGVMEEHKGTQSD